MPQVLTLPLKIACSITCSIVWVGEERSVDYQLHALLT
jgi:hypothetical protein